MQQCAFRFAAQAASKVGVILAPESEIVRLRGREQLVKECDNFIFFFEPKRMSCNLVSQNAAQAAPGMVSVKLSPAVKPFEWRHMHHTMDVI